MWKLLLHQEEAAMRRDSTGFCFISCVNQVGGSAPGRGKGRSTRKQKAQVELVVRALFTERINNIT